MFGHKAMAGTDDPDIAARQHLPFGDIGDREDRPAEHEAAFLALRPGVVDVAEGGPGIADIRDQPRQFLRLQGKRTVRAAVGPAERHMLFDRRGAERDGGGRHGRSQRVVRQADLNAEAAAHVVDRAQVGLLRRRRIAADAMQRHQLFAIAAAGRLHRVGDFALVGHAGRDDHGFSGPCGARDHVGRVHRTDRDRRRVQRTSSLTTMKHSAAFNPAAAPRTRASASTASSDLACGNGRISAA